MYEFLTSVEPTRLRDLVRTLLPLKGARSLENASKETLRSILFSAFAYDLLYEQPARQALLLSLGPERLSSLAIELEQDPSRKPYDIALEISSMPWRVGGQYVWRFAELFGIPSEYLPARSRSNDGVEELEPYTRPFPMFDYQVDIVEQINDLLGSEKGSTRLLVQLPTGAGKTRTAIEAIVRHYNQLPEAESTRGSLWLAHSEELCEQAIDTFRSIWLEKGKNTCRVARFWGGYRLESRQLAGAFVFATFQKMHYWKKGALGLFRSFANQLHLLVVDEAHKSTAPTYRELIEEFARPGRTSVIGLTATPGRSQEETEQNRTLARLFAGRLVTSSVLTSNPISELQKRGILSNVSRVAIDSGVEIDFASHYDSSDAENGDLPVAVLKALSTNEDRNALLLSLAEKELSAGKQTILFACSVDHAKTLSLELGLRGRLSGCIHYAMRRNQRRRLIQAFRDKSVEILLNYGVLSTGFDAPNVQTVIIARPTSSIVLYSQMIGRGLRGAAVGGTADCTVIDIKDNFLNFGEVDQVYSFFAPYWKRE